MLQSVSKANFQKLYPKTKKNALRLVKQFKLEKSNLNCQQIFTGSVHINTYIKNFNHQNFKCNAIWHERYMNTRYHGS